MSVERDADIAELRRRNPWAHVDKLYLLCVEARDERDRYRRLIEQHVPEAIVELEQKVLL